MGLLYIEIQKKQIIIYVALSVQEGNMEANFFDRRSKLVHIPPRTRPAFKVPSASMSFIERMEPNAEASLLSISPCNPKLNEESRHGLRDMH